MDENHQDEVESKMKTRFALAVYCLAIAFLTACAVVIVVKLIFWPPCTHSGNICVIDGWSVAGLAGTILGVAATLLAVLGAIAVAAWWGYLDDRVTNQVNRLYSAQEKKIEQQIRTEANKLILKNLVTGSELDHLRNLDRPEFHAVNSGSFLQELRQLQMLGFIEGVDQVHGITSLDGAFSTYGRVNVKDHLRITEKGKAYLEQVK